ncbi:cytochrome c oxidase subunit 8B [Scleropages formosus]|uniref:Cytochrome c oxidase subunit 8B n=1 Tax=Scleropages formosus TaxID=113540 RepID=A0A8C9U7I2_SCLFO|nr:cytochrome c oxidase subunit 8A, mitochondrial [Scleropages formosus]
MSGFNRSFHLLRRTLSPVVTPRATITAKPPKHHLSVADQTIAMVILFACILVPSGWVMANLEEYKKR